MDPSSLRDKPSELKNPINTNKVEQFPAVLNVVNPLQWLNSTKTAGLLQYCLSRSHCGTSCNVVKTLSYSECKAFSMLPQVTTIDLDQNFNSQ